MFGRSKRKKREFDKAVSEAVSKAYRKGLVEALKVEEKKVMPSGKEEVDWETTVGVIRTKIRLLLDFVDNLENRQVEKNGKK